MSTDLTPAERLRHALEAARDAVPESFRRAIQSEPGGTPEPGELWRVSVTTPEIGRHACPVWVRRVLPDGVLDVIPVVMDPAQATELDIVLGKDSMLSPDGEPLGVDGVLLTALRMHIDPANLINRFGTLGMSRVRVDAAVEAIRHGECPEGVTVGDPVPDVFDARLEHRAEVQDALLSASPAGHEAVAE